MHFEYNDGIIQRDQKLLSIREKNRFFFVSWLQLQLIGPNSVGYV
jgi:hypothetical protein